jgi:hypothetical protein
MYKAAIVGALKMIKNMLMSLIKLGSLEFSELYLKKRNF